MKKRMVMVLLGLICVTCAHAADDDEFDVSFSCGWDGYYRPMEWTPVEVGISSDLKEPFGGTFIVSAPQDGLNTLNVMRAFVLTPGVPQTLSLVTKLAFGVGRCRLEIRDQRGRMQWDQGLDMWDCSGGNRLMRVVQERDLLVGVVGAPQFGLLRLPRESLCVSSQGHGKVCVGNKTPRMVPWDWTGFVSLDLLVLYDPDWTLLRDEQLEAVGRWISNGGRLLIVLGRHPPGQGNPLMQHIPFQIGEPRQAVLAPETLAQWQLDATRNETVTAWPLFPKPEATLLKSVRTDQGGYLHALSYSGFGRVAVLGFDPAQLSQSQSTRAAGFWTTHIAACLGGSGDALEKTHLTPDRVAASLGAVSGHRRSIALAPSGEDPSRDEAGRSGRYGEDDRYRISLAQIAGNQVMEHLYQLKQMRPLSIWWVILTLTALALLLGPVDYLVLKRLDRLPWTWVTSTAWIVIFTVGAYYGVQALRGGRMQLRAISVLDGVGGADCAWATCYAGLFSPRSADYRLEGLAPGQWWSGIAPSQEEMWAHQRESAMRQIRCVQEDGSNLPVSVPINIWTVQSLVGESPLSRLPFDASVERRGEELAVEIANLCDEAIVSAVVMTDDAYVEVGPVPARETRSFQPKARPFNPWRQTQRMMANPAGGRGMASFTVPRYPDSVPPPAASAFLAPGCFDRTQTMHAQLRQGAAVVCAVFADAPLPFGLQDRSYEIDHVKVARQIVFPRGVSKEENHD